MSKGVRISAVVISLFIFLIDLILTGHGYWLLSSTPDARADEIEVICIALVLFGVNLLYITLFRTPHSWIINTSGNEIKKTGIYPIFCVLRVGWLLIVGYVVFCFARCFNQDKAIYAAAGMPWTDFLVLLSWGLLLTYEFCTYHLMELQKDNGHTQAK